MEIYYGDMFEHNMKHATPENLFLVTGNATIKKDGSLVMGRGAALQLKQTIPNIDKTFGQLLSAFKTRNNHTTYGILGYKVPETLANVGVFQVKNYFRAPATLEYINNSTRILNKAASKFKHVHINYPGIGAGWLKEDLVEPIIRILPDNVKVWKYEADISF